MSKSAQLEEQPASEWGETAAQGLSTQLEHLAQLCEPWAWTQTYPMAAPFRRSHPCVHVLPREQGDDQLLRIPVPAQDQAQTAVAQL